MVDRDKFMLVLSANLPGAGGATGSLDMSDDMYIELMSETDSAEGLVGIVWPSGTTQFLASGLHWYQADPSGRTFTIENSNPAAVTSRTVRVWRKR